MIRPTKESLGIVFPNYVRLWEQVDIEYRLTPGWRFIRKFKLLNQMGRITKKYERWFDQWLENSNSQ